MLIDSNTSSTTASYYENAKNGLMGDHATQLAAMLIDYAKDSREQNRQLRRGEEAHLRLVQQEHITDLRTEANMIRRAGREQGYAMIVSGGLTIGASIAGAKGACDAAGAMNASAKGMEGRGLLLSSNYERQAGMARADAAEHKNQSEEALRRLEDIASADESAKDLQRKAFDHLRAIQETRAATDRALTSWRG